MTSENTIFRIGNEVLEIVEEYIYLVHTMKLGSENQNAETNRRVQMTWAIEKLSYILKNSEI